MSGVPRTAEPNGPARRRTVAKGGAPWVGSWRGSSPPTTAGRSRSASSTIAGCRPCSGPSARSATSSTARGSATRSTRRSPTSPSGRFLVAVVLDLIGAAGSAFWPVVVGQVVPCSRRRSPGWRTTPTRTGTARTRATIHGTIMVVGARLTVVSLVAPRRPRRARRQAPSPSALLLVGFLLLSAGAFVGGDVVFVLGNMVSRHAFRGAGTKWIRLDTGDVDGPRDAARGDPAQDEGRHQRPRRRPHRRSPSTPCTRVCAHAGGPMAEGTVTPDGCLECPWHGSRFRLSDGRLRRGPAVYDQPAYEVRAAEAVATRSGARTLRDHRRDAASSCRVEPDPPRSRAWSCSSARPDRASRRSQRRTSRRTRSCPPTRFRERDRRRRRGPAGDRHRLPGAGPGAGAPGWPPAGSSSSTRPTSAGRPPPVARGRPSARHPGRRHRARPAGGTSRPGTRAGARRGPGRRRPPPDVPCGGRRRGSADGRVRVGDRPGQPAEADALEIQRRPA